MVCTCCSFLSSLVTKEIGCQLECHLGFSVDLITMYLLWLFVYCIAKQTLLTLLTLAPSPTLKAYFNIIQPELVLLTSLL